MFRMAIVEGAILLKEKNLWIIEGLRLYRKCFYDVIKVR